MGDGNIAKVAYTTYRTRYRVCFRMNRIKAIETHPKLFKNWTVHEGKIYFHNKDQLLDSLEIDDLDSWKLVLPTELRLKALCECHDQPQAGHLGIHKTYKWLTRTTIGQVYGKILYSMFENARRVSKLKSIKINPLGLRTVEGPWTTVAMDIIGPQPRSKNGAVYALVLKIFLQSG